MYFCKLFTKFMQMGNEQRELIHKILKEYWGYDGFRPLQEDIILSVLNHQDTLALLPTGGGKSICFQVPGLALKGLCLVISPLIALMKDQVENLKRRKVQAAAIYSGMSQHEIDLILNHCVYTNDIKFLYVSPERLKTAMFRNCLTKMNISLIAVDEAHCISQWGYDFRPPYLEIAEIRKLLPKVPVLALTATATPKVVDDIQDKLAFAQHHVYQKSFKRDNLTYFVVKEEDKYNRMLRIINKYPGTGIVYVRNRKKTQVIADFLKKQGITADFYHAGLDTQTRDSKQNDWMKGSTRVIVSTNAFGMGIDKPDVRFVIHLDIPDNLEAYFQEAGRGGRDEKPSVAILLYDDADLRELKKNFDQSYPPLSTIKNIYEKLCEYCSLPIGEGKDTVHNFDLNVFIQRYKLNAIELFSTLQFLERGGYILLSEELQKVSTLHICAGKLGLERFQEKNPKWDEFTKLLIRSYGGLFTNYVKISEKEIARRADISEEKVVSALTRLAAQGIVSYTQGNTNPHLLFLENRIDERYFFLSDAIYKQRKLVAQHRLDAVIRYVKNDLVCRSEQLLAYFGETRSSRCMKCDVCIQINKSEIENKEFENIKSAILQTLQEGDMDLKKLTFILSAQYPEEKIAKVLRWLNDQNKVKIDSGKASLR